MTPEAPEEMLPGLRAAVGDARTRAAETRRRNQAAWEPATTDPVARVLLDVPLPHLDRSFDYAVPEAMSASAVPGARVKVRFAGQEAGGFVVARAATSDHPGRLQPLRRVVSPEPVLAPAIEALSLEVATAYAGARADVLRLAVPPRHARTEGRPSTGAAVPEAVEARAWEGVVHGPAYVAHVTSGGAPAAVWTAAPGDDWPAMLAVLAGAAAAAGRGVVICVPDQRDLDRLGAAMTALLGADTHAVLAADAGPAVRYEQFLALSRGTRRIAIGTRSAAFAPVRDLGLVVVWDDGDDLHAEPRAPYPHVREVLRMRAGQEGAAMLVAGFSCTPEAAQWVATGFAHQLAAPRETVRSRARVSVVPGADKDIGTRVPRPAAAALRAGVEHGPVLVQIPRAGYVPALACERCRTPARCRACSGPLVLPGPGLPPSCRWCGRDDQSWACQVCSHRGLRAPVRGAGRTAEELGRMIPGVVVRSSSGDRVIPSVGPGPAVVVATVGAEPVAEGGYTAVVLLDTWLTLGRDDMRVDEEALRRWMGAAALVRHGGEVVAVGDPGHPTLQALVRWDGAGHAERLLAERAQAHLPPAARVATITGEAGAVSDMLVLVDLPDHAEVLGPVPSGEEERVVVRVPHAAGHALATALGQAQRARSARKLTPVRVQLDPVRL
jgi:primosomal protein N' (replication factor Y)